MVPVPTQFVQCESLKEAKACGWKWDAHQAKGLGQPVIGIEHGQIRGVLGVLQGLQKIWATGYDLVKVRLHTICLQVDWVRASAKR
jgi:hypothetical protein